MSNTQAFENLFEEFEPVTREAWLDRVKSDFRGEEFDKKLVWHTLEEFNVQPFYTREDLKNLGYLK